MEGIRAGKFLLELCYFVLALGEEARLLFFDLFQAGIGAVGHFLGGDHGILPLRGVWGFHCFLGKQEADGIRDWQCRFIESDCCFCRRAAVFPEIGKDSLGCIGRRAVGFKRFGLYPSPIPAERLPFFTAS